MELAAAEVAAHTPMLVPEGEARAAAAAMAERLGIPQHQALMAALTTAVGARWSARAVAANGRPDAAVITLPQEQLIGADGRTHMSEAAAAVVEAAATRAAAEAGIELDRSSTVGLRAVAELQAEITQQWSGGLLARRVQIRANAWSRQQLRPILRGTTHDEALAMQESGHTALRELAEMAMQATVDDEARATPLGTLVGAEGRDALAQYAVACAMRTAMGVAHTAMVGQPDERGVRRWRVEAGNRMRAWRQHLTTMTRVDETRSLRLRGAGTTPQAARSLAAKQQREHSQVGGGGTDGDGDGRDGRSGNSSSGSGGNGDDGSSDGGDGGRSGGDDGNGRDTDDGSDGSGEGGGRSGDGDAGGGGGGGGSGSGGGEGDGRAGGNATGSATSSPPPDTSSDEGDAPRRTMRSAGSGGGGAAAVVATAMSARGATMRSRSAHESERGSSPPTGSSSEVSSPPTEPSSGDDDVIAGAAAAVADAHEMERTSGEGRDADRGNSDGGAQPSGIERDGEAALWWAGDEVEVVGMEGGRRAWMQGLRGLLIARARRGAWTIKVHVARTGRAELHDVASHQLRVTAWRAARAGDVVEAEAAGVADGARRGAILMELRERCVHHATGEGRWLGVETSTKEAVTVREGEWKRATDEASARACRLAAAQRAREAAGTSERVVAAAQRAYKESADWEGEAVRAAATAAARGDRAVATAGIAEAHGRWRQQAGSVQMVTLNHGGMVTRLREAVTQRERLRREVLADGLADIALSQQTGARLFTTLEMLSKGTSLVMLQETKVRGADEPLNVQIRGLLTTGRYAGWKLLQAPAGDGDEAAGAAIWYDDAVWEELSTETVVEGRLQVAKMRVRADGTLITLANAYFPTGGGSGSAAATEQLLAMREGLQAATERAEVEGQMLIIGGDIQAQTQRGREEMSRDGRRSEHDDWFDLFCLEWGYVSVGEVEPTYVAEGGAVRSCIDHWMVSEGEQHRCAVELGPGADGLFFGVEGEAGAIEAEGAARKGHNSLVLRVRLETRAGEEAEEAETEEWDEREPQIPPMDKAEWGAFLEQVDQEVESAWQRAEAETADGFGAARRRLEAIEHDVKALAKRVKEIGEETRTSSDESKAVRYMRKALMWRRWMRQCADRARFDDSHPMFTRQDCGGAFGGAPAQDEAFAAVVEGSAAGAERRVALEVESRRRYLLWRERCHGEVAVGAEDPDRIRTALTAACERARAAGGSAVWEIFRAIGRCRAELAGKRTAPRGGRPGMRSIRPGGSDAPVSGKDQVLRVLHADSQVAHNEQGGGACALLEVAGKMEADGLPMRTPRRVMERRWPEELDAERQREHASAEAHANAEAAWRDARAETGEGADVLLSAAFQRVLGALREQIAALTSEQSMDAAYQRFRELQGVGEGGFSGIWMARASAATRRRYAQAVREVAADVLAAGRELEAATTEEGRRRAIEAVRAAAPRGWTRWWVMLLTKPGKPLDTLKGRRDICL